MKSSMNQSIDEVRYDPTTSQNTTIWQPNPCTQCLRGHNKSKLSQYSCLITVNHE